MYCSYKYHASSLILFANSCMTYYSNQNLGQKLILSSLDIFNWTPKVKEDFFNMEHVSHACGCGQCSEEKKGKLVHMSICSSSLYFSFIKSDSSGNFVQHRISDSEIKGYKKMHSDSSNGFGTLNNKE